MGRATKVSRPHQRLLSSPRARQGSVPQSVKRALITARAFTAGALLTLAVWSQAAAQEGDVRVPAGDRLLFRGVVSLDDAGGRTGPMMLYPGGVAGLVVGVLTHGTLESTARQREKDRIQEAADRVLVPYAPVLAAYKPRELMER